MRYVLPDRLRIVKLIQSLSNDLPKLESDESYQDHEPTYYNYAVYYEDLVSYLLNDLVKPDAGQSLFGAFLASFVTYQVLEVRASLASVVKMLIEELQLKLTELDLIEQEDAKKPKTKKRKSKVSEEDTDSDNDLSKFSA